MSTGATYKFSIRLGFKQYDIILTKEQSVLTKIKGSFEGKNMQTQYSMYRIDLYFQDYRLAVEVDENGHSDQNIDYVIKTQKSYQWNIYGHQVISWT